KSVASRQVLAARNTTPNRVVPANGVRAVEWERSPGRGEWPGSRGAPRDRRLRRSEMREEWTVRSAKIEPHGSGIDRLHAHDRRGIAEERPVCGPAGRHAAFEAGHDGRRVERVAVVEPDAISKSACPGRPIVGPLPSARE